MRTGPRTAVRPFILLLLIFAFAACGNGGDESTSEDGTEVLSEDATDAEAADANEESEDGEAKSGDEDGEEEEKKRPERAISVTATAAGRGELVLPVVAEGSIRARNTTEMKFELGGHIRRLYVQEGDRVKKGQRLVAIDDREYQVALEEAQSRYLQALGQIAAEEDDVRTPVEGRRLADKLQELKAMEVAGKITRQERYERELELGIQAVKDGSYRRDVLEVRSGLSMARADQSRAELNIERSVVRAPFNGVITALELTTGERVQPGQAFARLVDDVNIEAEVGVLESDLGVLQVGRPVLLSVPALGETIPLVVDVISPDIDATSRTCRVLMRMKSEDGRVKPGMFVRASIAGEIFPDKLLVPRQAILTRDGRPLLFRVDGDRSKWVYVQLGLRNDSLVEIEKVLQGGPLEEGTLVIVDNHLTLTHDAKIKVKTTLDLPDPWAEYSKAQ